MPKAEEATSTEGIAERGHVLLLDEDTLDRLRAALLADAPLESAAFLLARAVCSPTGVWRLMTYDVIAVAPDEYRVRLPEAVVLPPDVVARVLQRARRESASIVLVHSHPADAPRGPSPQDRAGERALVPTLARRVPGVPHARLILGSSFVHAAAFVPSRLAHAPDAGVPGAGSSCRPDPSSMDNGLAAMLEAPLVVREIGRCVRSHTAITAQGSAPVLDARVPGGAEEREHGAGVGATSASFDRQVRAFGAAGQAQLAALRVAVVGLGGTGSVVVEQLAHLGVQNFVLIDPDVIEPSNLNRVVGATISDVGKTKVDVAAALIARVRPGARTERICADVRDTATARRLLDVDFFFGCTDSQGSRAVLSQLAYQYFLPGIDMGVAIHARGEEVTHVTGRVQMLAPGLACLLCNHVLDPEAVRRDLLTDEARTADPYVVGAAVPQPAVISINGTASSLAVTMFLSAMVGIPVAARHQRLRLETGTVAVVSSDPAPTCPWCSPEGALGRGDSWPMPGRVGATVAVFDGASARRAVEGGVP